MIGKALFSFFLAGIIWFTSTLAAAYYQFTLGILAHVGIFVGSFWVSYAAVSNIEVETPYGR